MCTQLSQRQEAVQLYYYHKQSKADICRQLNCTRTWLDRWLKRYDPDNVIESLSDRSRAPRQTHTRWSAAIRQQVIEMRRWREQQPYLLISAEAIYYELKALESAELPPIRTIHRWLVEADLVKARMSLEPSRESKPICLPQAQNVNEVQQLDLKGPVYLQGSGDKYYLVVLRDCYSRRCAMEVISNRQAQSIVDFLVSSWRWLGLPDYLQMDNALEFRGSNRYPRSFGRVVRVAVDLDIEPVFIPPAEPWRNGGVESCNNFIQQHLLSQHFADLTAFQQATKTCQQACNQSHRWAALDGATPNEISATVSLRHLPQNYQRHQAKSLSQDKGFVSFVRLVRKSGRITLGAGDRFMVDPDLAYTYILARVDLAHNVVVISQNGQTLKSYDFSSDTIGLWADLQPN